METTWLSIEKSIERILPQWNELKTHFKKAFTDDKCHKAKILQELFSNDTIRLYLIFLKPILCEVQNISQV